MQALVLPSLIPFVQEKQAELSSQHPLTSSFLEDCCHLVQPKYLQSDCLPWLMPEDNEGVISLTSDEEDDVVSRPQVQHQPWTS